MSRRRSVPPSAVWLVAGMALLVLAGCGEEGVTTYTVPKEKEPPAPEVARDPGRRLLGAIVPRDKATWFFKLTGPDAAVAAQAEAFQKFLESVRFPAAGKVIDWTKPDDWAEGPDKPGRYATLLVGPQKLELSVTTLGPLQNEGENTVLGNVNRWRGQLRLAPVTAAELEKTTKPIKVGGVDATLVDIARPGQAADPRGKGKLNYEVPADWKEAPNDELSSLRFLVTKDGRQAVVTLSLMRRQDVLSNVNRWRNQLGLKRMTEAELAQNVGTIELKSGKAPYADFSAGGQRLLGVLADHGDGSWVFKMRGDADQVGSQKAAFEAFVKSVRVE
jgi:hypothetical protein